MGILLPFIQQHNSLRNRVAANHEDRFGVLVLSDGLHPRSVAEARNRAKVVVQVRLLARILWTLEPDGKATGCNPVEVGSTPTGVFRQLPIPRLVRERFRTAGDRIPHAFSHPAPDF